MGLGEYLRLVGEIWLQSPGKNCRIKINKCLIKCLQKQNMMSASHLQFGFYLVIYNLHLMFDVAVF